MQLVGCCKGCKDRHVMCHSDCEIYKNFRLKLEEINKKRRYDNLVQDYGWGYTQRRRKS